MDDVVLRWWIELLTYTLNQIHFVWNSSVDLLLDAFRSFKVANSFNPDSVINVVVVVF
jgi:hypothetical protein